MKKLKRVMMEWGAPALALALALPVSASAQLFGDQPPITAPSNITRIGQLTGVICIIVNWIFWLLIVLAIVFVLFAAFKYLTAGGEPEKVKSAGSTLLYAAVAVVIALIARGLPYIVNSLVGGGLSGVAC